MNVCGLQTNQLSGLLSDYLDLKDKAIRVETTKQICQDLYKRYERILEGLRLKAGNLIFVCSSA
jgi:hypothetical protein